MTIEILDQKNAPLYTGAHPCCQLGWMEGDDELSGIPICPVCLGTLVPAGV